MKPYQRTAILLVVTSGLFALIATFIPEASEYDSYPIDSWFQFMSFGLGFGAFMTVLFGTLRDNL